MKTESLNQPSMKNEFWESKVKFQPNGKGSAKVSPTMRFNEAKYLKKIMAKEEPAEKWWQTWYVFHPEAGLRVLWDMLILVFIIHQALSVPYFICFNDVPSATSVQFEFFMSLCFLLDILISFNTGFYIKGDLVLIRLQIVKTYLKFWFWMDIIASLPYNWFIGGVLSTDSTNSGAYNAPKVLRIIRIFRFLKILRLLRLAKLKKILIKIEDFIASNTLANIFVFAKLLALVMFIAHWTACLWFLIGDQDSESHPVTWVTNLNLQNKSFFEKYITSLYWALTTMSTVGYGDITPFTVLEKIYAMLTMIMASGVFAYTIGSIGSLVSKANAVENEYREQVVAANRYMKRKNLPNSLQFRVRRYLDYIWEVKKQNKMDEKSILVLLSEPLRDEIYSHIHGVVIKFCKIFEKFESNFIAQLAHTLINETFAPGDTIIEEGEMTTKMYFIMNGKVIIYHNFTKSFIRELGDKEHFGEISFFTEHPRCASVKCLDFLDVLSLTRLNLSCLIEKFPEASLINKQLAKSCEKGDYCSLLISCYICEEPGHYATKCSSLMVNLDQKETRSKWLRSKHIQESRLVSLSENLNPNFQRRQKGTKLLHYAGRNVLGVPRDNSELPDIREDPPVKVESSTGESVKNIQVRPAYTEHYLDSKSDEEKSVEKYLDRSEVYKFSLFEKSSHNSQWKNTFRNSFNTNKL